MHRRTIYATGIAGTVGVGVVGSHCIGHLQVFFKVLSSRVNLAAYYSYNLCQSTYIRQGIRHNICNGYHRYYGSHYHGYALCFRPTLAIAIAVGLGKVG